VGRGIIQFKLILDELKKGGNHTVTTIAIDKGRALALQKEGFHPGDIADYHTRNMLKIIKEENPDILITDFSAPETNNLINAAHYTGLPALMIDCGIKSDSSPIAREQNKHLLSKFGVWLRSGQKFQSLPFALATLRSTSRPWQLPARLLKELLNFFHGLPGYVEGVDIAVLSPAAKEWFIRDGIPPEHLFVIGQPRFDLILKQKYNPARLRSELGIPEDKGIIVLATQPMVESYLWTEKEREKFIKVVAEGMKDFPEKQLVMKLHPDENMDIYRQILGNIGDDKTTVCRDTDTYELLHACDLLITFYSTVALEAMLFNKPVITMNLFGKTDIFPFARSGAALGVYQAAELVPAMKKALYDAAAREELARKSREFACEHAYKPDGQASKRGAELILQLLEEAAVKRNNV
jgi:glycosyltransferase involved in cell wall biosynthesis